MLSESVITYHWIDSLYAQAIVSEMLAARDLWSNPLASLSALPMYNHRANTRRREWSAESRDGEYRGMPNSIVGSAECTLPVKTRYSNQT